jgi:alkylation response protein AidB-like acyl-CoA dehydrogenase
MHGAYGLTEQAEAQRYYRRSAVDTLLYGSPSQLRAEAAALMAV